MEGSMLTYCSTALWIKTKSNFLEKCGHVYSVIYSSLLLIMFTWYTDVGNFLQFLLSLLFKLFKSSEFLLHTFAQVE